MTTITHPFKVGDRITYRNSNVRAMVTALTEAGLIEVIDRNAATHTVAPDDIYYSKQDRLDQLEDGWPQTFFLTGFHEEINESVKALLFGLLADLAWDTVKEYRSDLYHDAKWIQEHVEGPCGFFFAFADSGTAVGFDERYVGLRNPDRLYSVDLVMNNRGSWNAVVVKVVPK
jgi:hypothetical protein